MEGIKVKFVVFLNEGWGRDWEERGGPIPEFDLISFVMICYYH